MTTKDDAFQEASDPRTGPGRLAAILSARPDLAAAIAQHPHAYPELLSWIAQHGDPAARPVVIDRIARLSGRIPEGSVAAHVDRDPSLPETGAAVGPHVATAPRAKRRRLIWVIGAAATAVVLAVAGWYVVGSGLLRPGGANQAGYFTKLSQPHKVWQVDTEKFGAPDGGDLRPWGVVDGAGLLVAKYLPTAPAGTPKTFAVISAKDLSRATLVPRLGVEF